MRACAGFIGVAILWAWLAAAGSGQTVPPAATEALRAGETAPAPTAAPIEQPAEFMALATKAMKMGSVYIKGVAVEEGDGEAARQREFEIWARKDSARQRLAGTASAPAGGQTDEWVATDGKHVFAYRKPADGEAKGKRRRLTAANMYESLLMSALPCDAAGGYRNLAAAVKFSPAQPDPRLRMKQLDLKWFALSAVGQPEHDIVRGAKSVRIGLSPVDGLVRVVMAQGQKSGKDRTLTIHFSTVKLDSVKDADLLLPPEAAGAKWEDADAKQAIAAPKQIIAE